MKLLFSALIAVGLSLAASPSFAADSRNVTVVNETGYEIKFLGFNGPDDGLDEWDNELESTLKMMAAFGTSKWSGKITMRPCSGRTSICASSPRSDSVTIPGPRQHRS
jgi:hypothetical protein